MKKIIYLISVIILVIFIITGCMDNKSENSSSTNSKNEISSVDSASKSETANDVLGEYQVDIKSCRLAKDFEGKDIVIVNYSFKNNSDTATSFTLAINDKVYQNGIGLNKCYTAADSAKYSSDNQSKNIKKGTALDIEVAYTLNDTSTPIEVECSELISFNKNTITKKFNIK